MGQECAIHAEKFFALRADPFLIAVVILHVVRVLRSYLL